MSSERFGDGDVSGVEEEAYFSDDADMVKVSCLSFTCLSVVSWQTGYQGQLLLAATQIALYVKWLEVLAIWVFVPYEGRSIGKVHSWQEWKRVDDTR